jgi:hypothetical protein
MSEPRKPIFGFLWPKPDPDAPVDDAYQQVRRVRVTGRGPIRIVALVLGTGLLVVTTGTLILTALATSFALPTVLGSALSASVLVLILRGWVVGTYVNDEGISIDTTWRRVVLPWGDVRGIETSVSRCPFVGIPLPVRAERAAVHTRDGRRLPTHVYATSPDLWLRPEAFDMARLRLEHWLPDSR